MDWNLTFWMKCLMLGVALSMDAFSVSMVNGLNDHGMHLRRQMRIATVFAVFQAFMPMLGWGIVRVMVVHCSLLTKAIPWVAFAMLSILGGKMLWEGLVLRRSEHDLSVSSLFCQGLATSLDALSVGVVLGNASLHKALVGVTIIAGVTWTLSMLGLNLGIKTGMKVKNQASLLGGVILILVAVSVLW